MKKIGVIGRREYRNTGIEKFQSKVIPGLTKEPGFEKISYQFSTEYPLSITVGRLKLGRRIEKISKKYDKIFVPSQDLVTARPSKTDAQIIPYIHDILPVTTNFSGWLATPLAKHYTRNIENFDKAIVSTRTTDKELKFRTRFSGETMKIYQGIELPEQSFDTERDIDLLYVGSLIDRKNPGFVEEVFEKAVEKGLTVASVNFEENSLPGESFVDISDRELARVYSRSRFYLHGSKAEGFGRTPVEAQFHGCIPLGFDIPINHEVLGDEGRDWLGIESVEDVFGIVESKTGSLDREVIRNNAGRFDWSRTVEQIKKVLLE